MPPKTCLNCAHNNFQDLGYECYTGECKNPSQQILQQPDNIAQTTGWITATDLEDLGTKCVAWELITW